MRASKSAGFTLIEILVVVGMLGILVSFAIPRLINARSNAQNSAAQVYAHNLMVWIASAETADPPPSQGSLVGSCLSTVLQVQGAPDSFPTSVSDCALDFEAGHYKATVTSATGKGGDADDGTFITYY